MDVDDAYENLVIRMNPPRVTIDNSSCQNATLVKVESANKHGSLLEVVQALTDFNLKINRAYISSDGEWFMDVFHVTDQDGNKVMDGEVINRIEQSLRSWPCSVPSLRRSVGVQAAAKHTSIELTGRDRPGLLSEVFAVLSDLKCNVTAAEVWTHNSRMASLVHVTDESTGCPIDDPERLATIKKLLRNVLRGDRDKRKAKTAVSSGITHVDRRLHQLMYADRDYEGSYMSNEQKEVNERGNPCITVEDFLDRGYSVINLRCTNRPKVLFDTEYYIRHLDGCTLCSEAERQRLIRCLGAAIRRRSSEGLRLELCGEDRLGLLSDVTRIFRENGLAVTGAEVTTQGSQAVNVFYVKDASGNPVKSQTIDAVRQQIGQAIQVKDSSTESSKFHSQGSAKFSLGDLFRSSSEKFLYNLGLIKSYS